jgi:hypothetical protein
MMSSASRRARRHAYMFPDEEQSHVTEAYVSSPPALVVVDESNTVWTLGADHVKPEAGAPRGEFAFEVLRNGVPTGEFASRIERRRGRIRIFTRTGWKTWARGKFFL